MQGLVVLIDLPGELPGELTELPQPAGLRVLGPFRGQLHTEPGLQLLPLLHGELAQGLQLVPVLQKETPPERLPFGRPLHAPQNLHSAGLGLLVGELRQLRLHLLWVPELDAELPQPVALAPLRPADELLYHPVPDDEHPPLLEREHVGEHRVVDSALPHALVYREARADLLDGRLVVLGARTLR